MKTGKILFSISILVTIAATVLASKSKIKHTFYLMTTNNGPCSYPIIVTGTLENQGLGILATNFPITNVKLTTSCPGVTLYSGL
ncbi:hypothetical protein ACE38W_01895 [Chitinophaga sp. Hz27]|uniref:hypothetical protein n=1 Tax=Chitinophaga sp. Hz27 TaxID=3347169 RepID=UPI0035E23017